MTVYNQPSELPLVLNGMPVDADWFNGVRNQLIPLYEQELSLDGPTPDITGIGAVETTAWTYQWTPSRTGTFEIHGACGHDGPAGEQAKFRLYVGGTEREYGLVEHYAGSFVDKCHVFKRVEIASQAAIAVGMTAQRISGASTFNSRIANRVLEIEYVGPLGLVKP